MISPCLADSPTGVNLRRYSVQGNDRMRVNISRWTRFMVLGIVVSAIATTGCSSGWKMPSMKMPWSKKPSESALAGSGPSALTYPTSPASKQNPNTIASAAAGKPATPGTATPPANLMAQGSVDRTATPSYSAPTGTAATAPGYKTPATGAAAGMNGYATGPYNTFGQTGAASTLATAGAPSRPATPPANQVTPGTPSTATGYASSNPYAPTNPYAPPAGSTAGLPSSQAYGSGVASNGVYGGRPSIAPAIAAAPSTTTPGSFAAPANSAPFGTPGLGTPSAPNGYASATPPSMPGTTPMNFPVNGGTYNPVGSAGPAMSAPDSFAQSSQGSPSMNGGFAMPTSQPSFGPTGSMTSVPAQTAGYATASTNNASTASYRPGSTSRSTGYNFAQQGNAPGQGNSPVVGAPNFSSSPYTASGTSNPGYSLPPSSTLNR